MGAPRFTVLTLLVLLGLVACPVARGADQPDFRPRVWKHYAGLRQRYLQDPKDLAVALQLARACFDIGEYATNSTERALLAEEGIAVSRKLIAAQSNSVGGHYYLGMNLGQLARTRGIGALKTVDQMESAFLVATELDPKFDYAGPHRNVGLLYREAPSFASVGSRTKARHHLQKAVVLAPEYLDNRLNLIESYISWKDWNGLKREMKVLDEYWEKAHQKFTGPDWEAAWLDWNSRLEKVRKKAGQSSRALASPQGSPGN